MSVEADTLSPPARHPLRLPRLDKSLWLPIAVVAVLIAFFSATTDSFATLRNFTAISGQAGALLIVCLGGTFVILMGSIDLSVGAIVLFVAAASVKLLNLTGVGGGVLFVAAGIGLLLGLFNGVIYAYGRIPSFVATLGTLSIFSGLALQILEGRAIQFDLPGFEEIAIGQLVPRLPNIALCALVAWALAVLIATRTRFGRYMYLIGGGETVARTAGIPVRRYKIYAFALSGLLTGIGAILMVARLGAAGPSIGQELLLNSLAAIVVGGTSLAGGVGGPHRTLIGVLIIAILDNGLNLLGVTQYSQMIVKGVVVIAAVLVSRERILGAIVK
ncbi:ABC transporter permease [Chelatococcus reniformis]|uniref:Sugar ABC transporter permease n=1 Tax=Chelatococcus reniformis TaxID=1494448 RepID=A0A916TW89_9HYPH|nr:ABC transporter permease [Chelatococcus reniformis]GGC45853.1 sugar ABC transporter permease [Chelatococcus reniformis]